MPKAFVAGLVHETNTFLEAATTLAHFHGEGSYGRVMRGQALYDPMLASYPMAGIIDTFEQHGWEVVPGMWAAAEPSGTVSAQAFEALAGEIIERLRAAGPVDAVCLDLHGAMVAEGFDDAEGELLARVRTVVGDAIPVVVALDLHGNISPDSVAVATAMVAYRCYPHTDMRQTGARAAQLAVDLHARSGGWHKQYRHLPFLMPIHRQTTLADPCQSLYAYLEELETADGVDSLSFLPGFPLADVPFAGPTILGFGSNAAALEVAVQRLFDRIVASEADFDVKLYSAQEGVARAIESSRQGPTLIADVQDNAGGGGTSDTIWVLDELIRQRAPDAILGLMCDPAAAEAAHAAGAGSRIELDLGGHQLAGHRPLRASYEVERLASGPVVLTGPMSKGLEVDLGKVALLRIDGIRIVVSSVRTQCHDTQYFRHLGINPEQHPIVVVKSTNHYRADFQPLVQHIIEVEGDGACRMNPARLAYQKLTPGIRLYGNGPVLADR